MDDILNSMYDDSFLDEINSSTFYANPKRTKLYLKKEGDNKEHIIGNAVVSNVEYSNEKIPVYSYNSDLYAKYLNGKKVITGMLALRRTTVDKLITFVSEKRDFSALEKERLEIEGKIKELDDLIEDGTQLTQAQKSEYKVFRQKYVDNKNKKMMQKENEYVFSRENGVMSDDILTFRDKNPTSDFSIKIVFEGELVDDDYEIHDLLFVKKQTDINIGKNDVIEIYQFIGNPKRNLTK